MKYKNMSNAIKLTGIHLKEIRECSGLSATDVAKKINKHHNVILSIENGTTDPSIMMLSSILSVFGLEIHEFFDDRYEELYKKIEVTKCYE